MADLSDVLTALGNLVQSYVYPNGTSSASVAGVDITIESGWPIPNSLDTALAAGKAHVSIFPTPVSHETPLFLREWQTSSIATPTLTAVVASNTITIGGTVSLPQAVMAVVNEIGYSYRVVLGDTLTTIATNLAALIPNATSFGAVITITNVHSIRTSIIVAAVNSMEVNRMEQFFWLIIHAPTPVIRDAIGRALNSNFSYLISFPLADNTVAMNWAIKDDPTDQLEETRLYKRTLQLKISYPITVTQNTNTLGDVYVNSIEIQHGD